MDVFSPKVLVIPTDLTLEFKRVSNASDTKFYQGTVSQKHWSQQLQSFPIASTILIVVRVRSQNNLFILSFNGTRTHGVYPERLSNKKTTVFLFLLIAKETMTKKYFFMSKYSHSLLEYLLV